jgi:hypothetical protein
MHRKALSPLPSAPTLLPQQMFYEGGPTSSREVYVHFLIGAMPHCTEAAPDQEDLRPKAHARAAGKRQALPIQKGIGLYPLSRVTTCTGGH